MQLTTIEEFLPYLESVRGRTTRVLRSIPEDRFEWSYKPGAFAFGDLVRHLGAIERWMFAENVAGRPSRYPGHGRELADGYQSSLDYLNRMHDESVAIFRALTPDDLRRKCATPGGADIATWKWLRSMLEHEIHHRGQIYIMLGMLQVSTPPLYGLTEEEVVRRSRSSDS